MKLDGGGDYSLFRSNMETNYPPLFASSKMIIARAHRIRLVPNRAQEVYFRKACGIRRFAYNWALAEWNRQYELYEQDKENNKRPSWMALSKKFNSIKKEKFPWIREVSSRIPERACRDVESAWKNFFKALKRGDRRFRPPRYKIRGRQDRFYIHNQELEFNGKRVRIGRVKDLGWIRTREEIRFNGKIMGGTIVRVAKHWYLSVQVTMESKVPPHPTGEPVGIDMGIANQFATSTGQLEHLPAQRMKELERQIRRAQKTLSRRWSGKIKKGHADQALRNSEGQASNKYRRQADRLAVLHRRLANVRQDALHKLSRKIVDAYELIAIEDLQLKNMTASAKGTVESPGRNVKAKAGLNRALQNASLREFRLMLEYKAEAAGGIVLPIDPAYTSQTCSQCGHTDKNSRRSQSQFCCTECGFELHADINAARNILKKAQDCGK